MALQNVRTDCLPMRTKDIMTQAEDFEFSRYFPLKTWLRTAKLLLIQATAEENNDDLQSAYLHTYRHFCMMDKIMAEFSPEERRSQRQEVNAALKQAQSNLIKLERWKPAIDSIYDRDVAALKAYQALRAASTRTTNDQGQPGRSGAFKLPESNRLSKATSIGLPVEQGNVREGDGLDDRQSIVEQYAQAHSAHSYSDYVPESPLASSRPEDAHDLSGLVAGMVGTRRLIDGQSPEQISSRSAASHKPVFQYPKAPQRQSEMDWSHIPKHNVNHNIAQYPEGGFRASKDRSDTPPALPLKPQGNIQLPGQTARAPIRAWTEGGKPLRTVRLPTTIKKKFLDLVHPNTAKNIETCGVLCATLGSNELIISHLVIPDQTGSSDMCDTTELGDAALFDYCDANNLIACGWIHTHPSQTCFLSSRDLHTSAGYQQMLAEAIAIVCAPRSNPDSGVFCLTDPPGLPAVRECKKQGTFHQHDEKSMYTDATHPRHVVEDATIDIRVVDLRK